MWTEQCYSRTTRTRPEEWRPLSLSCSWGRCYIISKYSFQVKEKTSFLITSVAIVALILISLSIFLCLALSLLLVYVLLVFHYINISTCDIKIVAISSFGLRVLVLIILAITILLVKAVLLTKDIAVCVPLDSKVQGVRKVTPVMSNRS